MKKIKALVLFSGGLDSVLAVKLLEKQGIETAGICFSSNFFGAEKARKIAKANGIKLFVEDFGQDILDLVKNPPHGLGKNMNPCIDCHSVMFKRARAFANQNGFDFLASGEILGQRPFSQNRIALMEVSKTVGEELLRPLSAKLLPETEIEKKGWVNRSQLLNLQGRQRNRQFELAEKLGIKEFEAPAGGCLLTDPDFGKRLEKAIEEFPELREKDVELLKFGRIYWLKLKEGKNSILVVIGRNKEDNENLENLLVEKDFLLKPKGVMGPNVLVRGFGVDLEFGADLIEVNVSDEKAMELDGKIFDNEIEMFKDIAILAGWYIKKVRGGKVEFIISEMNL